MSTVPDFCKYELENFDAEKIENKIFRKSEEPENVPSAELHTFKEKMSSRAKLDEWTTYLSTHAVTYPLFEDESEEFQKFMETQSARIAEEMKDNFMGNMIASLKLRSYVLGFTVAAAWHHQKLEKVFQFAADLFGGRPAGHLGWTAAARSSSVYQNSYTSMVNRAKKSCDHMRKKS